MRLILASASPRRRELLKELASDFLVVPSSCEEKGVYGAKETAAAFAKAKARDVYKSYPDCVVLGADTVVSLDNEVLGKPKTQAEAYAMLKALSGREHSVYTGVCMIKDGCEKVCVEQTKVTFFKLSDEKIAEYIKSGSPFDKAGGYGIQDGGLVASFEGSYTNVVGLPLEVVKRFLEELGDSYD